MIRFLVKCLILKDNAILRGNFVDFAFAKSLPYYQMYHKTSCISSICVILCVGMGESFGSIPAKYWPIWLKNTDLIIGCLRNIEWKASSTECLFHLPWYWLLKKWRFCNSQYQRRWNKHSVKEAFHSMFLLQPVKRSVIFNRIGQYFAGILPDDSPILTQSIAQFWKTQLVLWHIC